MRSGPGGYRPLPLFAVECGLDARDRRRIDHEIDQQRATAEGELLKGVTVHDHVALGVPSLAGRTDEIVGVAVDLYLVGGFGEIKDVGELQHQGVGRTGIAAADIDDFDTFGLAVGDRREVERGTAGIEGKHVAAADRSGMGAAI